MASSEPDLSSDALAPAPSAAPRDTVSIYGILGESSVASNARLHLDRDLTTYYDIPVEGIVAREKIAAEDSPLGVDSTLLTVQKSVRLAAHRVATRSVEAEFLAGDFTAPGSFEPVPLRPASRDTRHLLASGMSACFSCPHCFNALAAHEPQTENFCTGGMCHFAAPPQNPTETYCTGAPCHYANAAGAGMARLYMTTGCLTYNPAC